MNLDGGKTMNINISYNNQWKLLNDKGIKKTKICELACVSTNAMAKLGKNEPVQLDILIRICLVLNCKLDDIITFEEWGN